MIRTHLFFIPLFILHSFSATADDRGLEIAKKIRAANKGYVGDVSKTKMTIIDAHKRKVERLMNIKTIEVKGDGDRSLMTFIEPKDVRGTKMLTWEHGDRADDQWLYLPSLKRIKRIYGSGRSGSFMGSEFSYEDLSSGLEVGKYDYKFLSEKKGATWVVERRSKSKSHYSKNVITYSAKYMNPVEIKYYNKREELIKTAVSSEWEEYDVDGKTFWRARRVEMNNVQTNKKSILFWEKRTFVKSLKKREFRENSLR